MNANTSPYVLGHALYMKAIHGVNSPSSAKKIAYKIHRKSVAGQFVDPDVRRSIETDLELIDQQNGPHERPF